MESLKVLIVEDDPIIAKDLQQLLTEWGYQITGCAASSESAIRLFKDTEPDLALVDIQLNGEADGIDTVIAFNQIKRIPIIYLTAQADFMSVNRAKTSFPSSYILKPFDERSLYINIELAIDNFYHNQAPVEPKNNRPLNANEIKLNSEVILRRENVMFIKHNYKFVKINMDDLLYIEADHNHAYIVTKQNKFIVRMSISAIVDRLDHGDISRVHRSYAINVQHIDEIGDDEITIKNKLIPLGNSFREEFLRKFNVV